MIRHSIERKILLPFLVIVLLPSLIIGLVSMWSSYQSDKYQKLLAINETLSMIEGYTMKLNKQVKEGELAEDKAKALSKMMIHEISGLYVEDENGEITNQGLKIDQEDLDWINGKGISLLNKEFLKESTVITKKLTYWGWQLYFPVQFSIFSGSLPDIQKYTLLIGIFTSVIAVELTIIFSYHLSKPIRNLAEFCRQVSMGQKVKELNIRTGRKDEIGVLSRSLKEQ